MLESSLTEPIRRRGDAHGGDGTLGPETRGPLAEWRRTPGSNDEGAMPDDLSDYEDGP
jgi:hypothetical protein